MKKVFVGMGITLSVIAALFAVGIGFGVSVSGGLIFFAAALLFWPDISRKVASISGRRWIAPVAGLVLAVLAAPVATVLTMPSSEEMAAMDSQKATQAEAKKAADAEKAAKRAQEKREAEDRKAKEKRDRGCSDTTMAFVMSQKFVKQSLKSPTSAKFPYAHGDGVSIQQTGECKFRVNGYVDAQNSFGAMLRSHYTIDMEYLPDSNNWRGSNLQM